MGEDERDQEGVADGTGRLQERCGVVEDKVDTSPLLHHLERGTENGLAEVGVGLEERTLEAVGPSSEPATSRDKLTLVLLVGNDLGKFEFDQRPEVGGIGAGWVYTTDLHQGLLGLIGTAALDKVTRGVGKAGDTTTQNKTPGELDTDGNAVLASVTAVLNGVVDAGSEKETDGDAELVTGNERTTNLLGANLGHVENDNSRLETDTNTGDGTTSDKEVTSVCSHLQDNTDDVDETSQNDRPLATNHVGEITSNESTKEGTSGKDRHNERGVAGADSASAIGGIETLGADGSLDLLDEKRRVEHTVNVTGIVSEEDTTERCESTKEVGLPGNGALSHVDISGSLDALGVGGLVGHVVVAHVE